MTNSADSNQAGQAGATAGGDSAGGVAFGEFVKGAPALCRALSTLRVCDVQPDTVHNWQRSEPPVPIHKAGGRGQAHTYRVADVIAWYRAREGREAEKGWTPPAGHGAPARAAELTGADDLPTDARPGSVRVDPKTEKLREEAAIARIKRQQLEGRLVPLEEVEPAYQSRVSQAKACASGWPAKLARMLEGVGDFDERRAINETEVEHFFALVAGSTGAAAQRGDR